MEAIDNKVFAIWSPKGGVGKTFIAGHLAKYAASKKLLTGVIDFNRQTPSITTSLDIKLPREKSLKEALFTERDTDVIVNFQNHQRNNNLFCLALNMTNKVDDLLEVTDQQVLRLLQIAKNKFNILFLDLPTSYFELTSYEGLKFADKIIIVIDNDYNSVLALKQYLKFFSEINIALNNLILVMNKNMNLISEEEILKLCGIPIRVTFPFNKQLIRDMNEGKTVYQNGGGLKDYKLIRGIEDIFALLIMDTQDTNKERPSILLRTVRLIHKSKKSEVSKNE